MVQRLDAEGLLKYEKYRGLVLTTAGETLARDIMLRHQLLTDFLRTLGITEEEIYHDVEGMEHHISPQTLQAIEALLFELRKNPTLVARIDRVLTASLRQPLSDSCGLERNRCNTGHLLQYSGWMQSVPFMKQNVVLTILRRR